jgi:(1->4)-alpha-D-glucan 1-alpha-D-glucosylmutase
VSALPTENPSPGSSTVPTATYRLQLHAGFTFADAAAVVPYVADLGVSHVYCSPYLQAAPGSTHGYDVVDHTRANAELGGEEGRRALVAAIADAGLQQVLDIVPNHMSVEVPAVNAWWWDVLRHGSASAHAGWFDIDWSGGRLLLPVLGGAGDLAGLQLMADPDEPSGWVLALDDRRWPVAEGTVTGPDDDPRRVHDRQHYELADWHRGNDELGYRRFFDITSLAGIRVEDAGVFDASHDTVLGWVAAGEVHGLRIDHPDGLADPQGYLERLAARAPGAWLVVEKILEPGEDLPTRWPVGGTTGYDVLRHVGTLLVDPAGLRRLDAYYAREIDPENADYAELVTRCKLLAARNGLRAEVLRLVGAARAAGLPEAVAADTEALEQAMGELLAAYPVYRSYRRPGWPSDHADAADPPGGGGKDPSGAVLDEALAAAAKRRPELTATLEALADHLRSPRLDERHGLSAAFCVRFQQTSGMVMAKGVEDTAYYRYHRLIALNEVGGDPGSAGESIEQVHAAVASLGRAWPATMTALSTHDTKRSEDVRARLSLASHDPDGWFATVTALEALAPRLDPAGVVDRPTRYLLWQTLLGAWPLSADRAVAYCEKASREAKQHTSWTEPDERYDAALAELVRAAATDPAVARILDERLADWGPRAVALLVAQKAVQLLLPGVPDVYQGTELVDLSLVDPDNRRPVDYGARRALLARLDAADAAPTADGPDALKLWVTSRLLRFRRAHADLMADGANYRPVAAGEGVVAFTRGDRVLLAARVRPGADDPQVTLPPGRWRSLLVPEAPPLTGGEHAYAALAGDLPVAVWVAAAGDADGAAGRA